MPLRNEGQVMAWSAAEGGEIPVDVGSISGNLAVSQFNNASGASSASFWRGDGVWAVPTAGDVDGLADPGSNGIVARTASNTTAARTLIGPAAGLAISNGNGVSGNPTFALANDLAALEALSTTGFAKRTGTDTWTTAALVAGDIPDISATYATKSYADSLVIGLLDDRGNYDASGNVFPSSGGSGTSGAIKKGDLWTISVAGTLGGHAVTPGDVVRALVDTPGLTDANWAIGENNFGYVALNQALADGKIYVGNAFGIGTAVTPSGDVTISNAGVTTIGALKVLNSMIANGTIDLTAKVTGVLPSANGGTGVSNAGTLTNASNTTISGGGTLSLGGFTFTVPATGSAAMINQANSFTLINPLTTIAESWIGPSSTNGVYFKAGFVGVGTTNPLFKFQTRVTADHNFAVYGALNLSDGVTLQSINDAGDAIKGLELRGSSVRLTDGTGNTLLSGGNLAVSGNINGAIITATNYLFVNNATANLYLKDTSTGWQAASTTVITPQANNSLRNINFTSGLSGWNIADAGNVEFNNGAFRGEFRASEFKINEISATAGTFGTFYSASSLNADVVIPHSVLDSFTFDAKNSDDGAMLFSVGDAVRIKAYTNSGGVIIGDTWARIEGRTNHTTYTTYTVGLRGGSTDVTFRAGTAIADYGPPGSGLITMSADGTVGSSPNLTMAVHDGSPWLGGSHITLLTRLGNLNNSYGYVVDTYGFGVGSYGVSGQPWLTVETTNGIRIGNNTTVLGQWDTSGTIVVGQVASGQSNVRISAGAVDLRNNTTIRTHLASDGSGYLANTLFAWDTSGNVTITGNATIAGWTVNSTYLAKDTGTNSTSAGMAPTDYPFFAGSTYANRATAPFRVTPAGALSATGADISGSITATSGSITGTLTMSGSGSAIAIGSTPPTSPTAGTGIWIDRNAIYALSGSMLVASLSSNGLFVTEKSSVWSGIEFEDATGTNVAASIMLNSRNDGTGEALAVPWALIQNVNSARTHSSAEFTSTFVGSAVFDGLILSATPVSTMGSYPTPNAMLDVRGDIKGTGILKMGSGPTTLTDAAGKILSAALNTVGTSQGGTGVTAASVGSGGVVLGNQAVSTTSDVTFDSLALSTATIALKMISSANGTNGSAQIGRFFRSNGSTSKAYWGFPSDDSVAFVLTTDIASSTISVIAQTGGVILNNGATSWSAISDVNSKVMSEFQPFTNAAHKLLDVRTGISRYKTDPAGTRRPFVIAQDFERILPEAVDLDPKSGMKTLRYSETIPLVAAATKENTLAIDELRSMIERQQNEIRRLNGLIRNMRRR